MEERYIYKIPVGFEAEIEEDMVVMHPKKESEDERIGKEIIEYIKVSKPYWSDFKDYRSWVAWLEKQKEQKPAEWSEEGKKMIEIISNYVKNIDLLYDSFKICEIDYKAKDFKRKVLDWLNSLRPQPHWKPSEEQMEMLSYVVEGRSDLCGDVLRSLYQDLKKLM